MKNRNIFCAGFALLLVSATSFAVTKEELKENFKRRHNEIVSLKQAGKIGETFDGHLEALNSEFAADAAIKNVLASENGDRDALYGILAAEKKTTAGDIAGQNAILKFNKAGTDEYFKGKDGTWLRKRDMVKK